MHTMRRIFYAPLTLIYVIRASRLMVKMRNHHEQRTDENYEKLSQLTYSFYAIIIYPYHINVK